MKTLTLKEKIWELTMLYETAREEGSEEEHRKVVAEILSLISQDREELVGKIEEMKNTWMPCYKKNCGNNGECERANHYIETIWNPTFDKILSLLKNQVNQ